MKIHTRENASFLMRNWGEMAALLPKQRVCSLCCFAPVIFVPICERTGFDTAIKVRKFCVCFFRHFLPGGGTFIFFWAAKRKRSKRKSRFFSNAPLKKNSSTLLTHCYCQRYGAGFLPISYFYYAVVCVWAFITLRYRLFVVSTAEKGPTMGSTALPW